MISVCVATYNGEEFIRQQVDSIRKQLGPDDEIVISDQMSTDGTVDILKSMGDDRIKIFTPTPTSTSKHRFAASHYLVTHNFENALSRAKGDYIFLSDQDDVWTDNKVEMMLPHLMEGKIVMSNYSEINRGGSLISEKHYVTNPVSKNFIKNMITQPFHGSCMAFPRKLLQIAIPFPKNLIMHDNWVGMIGLCCKYDFDFINVPLLYYRIHGNNVSHSKDTNPLYFKMYYRLILTYQILKRLLKKKVSNLSFNP